MEADPTVMCELLIGLGNANVLDDPDRVRSSTSTHTGSMNPTTCLHQTRGTPEPPTNSGRFRVDQLA